MLNLNLIDSLFENGTFQTSEGRQNQTKGNTMLGFHATVMDKIECCVVLVALITYRTSDKGLFIYDVSHFGGRGGSLK